MGSTTATGYQSFPDAYFNTKYVMPTINSVEDLKNTLCNPSFIEQLQFLFSNPSDFVNGLKYYPFVITDFCTVDSSGSLVLGGKTTTISANRIVTILKRVKIATVSISRNFNNFMDFEPYTKIDLYVPYFGFMNLPTNEVMGKILDLYLSVDFDTGIGTLYIETQGRVMMTSSTKLGLDIPLGASNMKEVIKENVANALKVTAGIATMALAPSGKMTGALMTAKGLSMAITSGIDAVTGSEVRYTKGSLTGGTDMLASPTSVYVVISRPNALPVGTSYNELKGKPLAEVKTLSQIRGFTIVEDVHLEGFANALRSELDEIESLLHSGVIL